MTVAAQVLMQHVLLGATEKQKSISNRAFLFQAVLRGHVNNEYKKRRTGRLRDREKESCSDQELVMLNSLSC